ncbi:starch-binding domain-containing protein 1 [Leptodactylus fuscus]|uniref:starch-binding domain-containing protein 1 n=1 Tax=Leptodactylus fuscus TaxID=238119 RepID=UPI003F4EDB74
MVQEAAAQQRSPIQGRQVSGSRCSMWPVLVLGILTAIIAWVWYRRSGEVSEPEPQKEEETVDTAVVAETAQENLESGDLAAHGAPSQCKPNTDWQEANRSQQGASCLGIQVTKTDQAKNEEKPRSQVKDTKVLSDIDHPGGGQSNAPATVIAPLILGADVPTSIGQGNLQRHEKNVLSQSEHLIYVSKEEEPQTGTQEQPIDVPGEVEPQNGTQEQPIDVPGEVEPQTGTQEQPIDVPGEVEPQTGTQEQPIDVPGEVEPQTGTQEQPIDVPGEEEPQTGTQEQPIDVPGEVEPQNGTQERPIDAPREEEPQTGTQERPIDVPGEKQDQANILEQQTSVPVKEDNLLEGHLNDLVGNGTEEGHKKNDELHSCEVDLHHSGIPDSRERLINEDKLYEEGYPQDNVDKAVTQTSGEAVCLTVMSEAPGLLGDSCHATMATPENGPGKEFLHSVKDSQDGFCVSGEMSKAKESVEKATGCLLENVFDIKDKNSMDVLTAKGTLNQDLYLEIVNISNNDGNAILERGDINRMYKCIDSAKTTGLQEDASVLSSSLHEFSQVGLSDVQKLGSSPKGSSVNILKEEETVGLGMSNTHEKTSLGCPSETNIHEADHQKTRKVATIQPMLQNVNFVFKVHYITQSDSQIIAITGDHEKLGKWETYVPLTSGNGGFWSRTVTLPSDTNLAWKFVMVENGKIKRWEECNNRFLKTAHEDLEAQLWWGYP